MVTLHKLHKAFMFGLALLYTHKRKIFHLFYLFMGLLLGRFMAQFEEHYTGVTFANVILLFSVVTSVLYLIHCYQEIVDNCEKYR